MAACKNGACSIAAPKSQARTKTPKPSKPKASSPAKKVLKLDRYTLRARDDKHHNHNCSECHSHTKTPSLTHKIHEKNGHQCTKPDCDIKEPHGHIHAHKKEEHVHGPHCNHGKKEESYKPLEYVINDSNLPQWLKHLSLNASFLTPALIINEVLEGSQIPKLLKTLLSISGMHFTNRGSTKLGRLGLTSLVASGTQLSGNSKLGRSFARFIATSLVAIIEKFSGNGAKQEFAVLLENLKNPKQWKELLPSLFNVEAKVQVIVPLLNKFIASITEGMDPGLKKISKIMAQIVFTSLSFVGFDQILKTFARSFGKDSFVASMVSATCGCCGSPVCAAAATDSALQNTLQ